MFITDLLAQVRGDDIIYGGLGAAQEVQESFEQLWTQVLGGPAYLFVSKTAGTMAAIFIIVWVYRHQKDLNGDAEHLKQIFLDHLFGPVLVFILLMVQIDGSSVLGATTLGMRNFSNDFTNAVLSQIAYQVNDPVTESVVKMQAQTLTTRGLQDCLKIPNEEQRNQCLTQLQAKVEKTLAPYRNEQWAEEVETKFDDQVQSITQNPVQAWFSDRAEDLGGVSDQVITAAIIIICSSISTAATWLIEIIGLMTAIVGPLVIAVCLLPKFEESWKPWLTGIAAVGGISMLYKFSIGLVGMQVLNSTGPVEMIGPICLALVGLVLITGFATGGGVAAFQIGQSTLSLGGGGLARAGGEVAKGLGGGATRLARRRS